MSGTSDIRRNEPLTCPLCGKTIEGNETLEAHSAKHHIIVQAQYDRLAQDWRQVHNIIWGIPTIAITIITGIILAAYQPPLEGWPRIIALGMGSIFLFALTVEIIKKRLLMNAISARLHHLENKSRLDPFPNSTEGLLEELEKDDKGKREKIADDKEEKRPDDKDPVYRLFKWSYARQFLAHVVFVAAIIVSILTYWEFVKYLNYPLWAYLVGIMPVLIISGLIAKIRYDNKKEADEKQTKK
jgi:hypothetical protein